MRQVPEGSQVRGAWPPIPCALWWQSAGAKQREVGAGGRLGEEWGRASGGCPCLLCMYSAARALRHETHTCVQVGDVSQRASEHGHGCESHPASAGKAMPQAAAAAQHAGRGSVALLARAGGRPGRGAPGGLAVPLGRAQPASLALRQAALCLLSSHRCLMPGGPLEGPWPPAASVQPLAAPRSSIPGSGLLARCPPAGNVRIPSLQRSWRSLCSLNDAFAKYLLHFSRDGGYADNWLLDAVMLYEENGSHTFTNMGWPSIALLHRCYQKITWSHCTKTISSQTRKYIAVFDRQT
eukprot:SM000226S07424  [mRNA]  locus=s226:175807:178436:- [translate_table: standard]